MNVDPGGMILAGKNSEMNLSKYQVFHLKSRVD
jgi:hypothetical protein